MSDVLNIIDWTGAKRMDLATFLTLAEPEERPHIVKALEQPISRVRGAVCFQDEDGGSAKFGQRYYLTFRTSPDALLASTHKGAGPIAYYEKDPE